MKVNPSTGLPLQIAYFIAHSSIKLLFGSPSSSQIEQRASQISWLWSAAHSTMWGGEEVGVLTLSGASGELLVVVALSRRLQVREERFERLDRRAEGPDPGAQLVVDVGLAPVVEVQLEPGPVPPIGRDLGVEQAQGRDVAYAQARGEGRGYDEGLVEDHGFTT